MRPRWLITALVVGVAAGLCAGQNAPSPKAPVPGPAKKAAPDPLSAVSVKGEFESILAAAADASSFAEAVHRAQAAFDRLAAYGNPRGDAESFRVAGRWLRLLRHLEKVPKEQRGAALRTLREHEPLASALSRALDPEHDDIAKVYALVCRLGEERRAMLGRFGELGAAVALVHDEPPSFERARASDALRVFDYFTTVSDRAPVSATRLPVELLVFVVDTPADADELWWALNRYPNERRPGKKFFEINYDSDNFKRNKPLKLDAHDFTLQSILKVGGVCRHQAYYASQVSKALGIPSVIDSARGAGTGHAWVGYLDTTASPPRWNFDEGRYTEYKGLMGNVRHPQTRRDTPDSTVALTAQFVFEPVAARELSRSLVDAAARLGVFAGEGAVVARAGRKAASPGEYPPAVEWGGAKPREARAYSVASRLALLEEAINASPASAHAWGAVASMAGGGSLDHNQIVRWSEAAVKFCGTDYPDFALEVLAPMFEGEEDPARQDRLWEWAYDTFYRGVKDARRRRVDLAAMIRFAQGEQCEKHGRLGSAWDRYKQVIVEFPNDGPFAVEAVARCAEMLKKHGKPAEEMVSLYKDAWRRIEKPGEMSREFALGSNWFRVGKAYERVLKDAGRENEARSVASALRMK